MWLGGSDASGSVSEKDENKEMPLNLGTGTSWWAGHEQFYRVHVMRCGLKNRMLGKR